MFTVTLTLPRKQPVAPRQLPTWEAVREYFRGLGTVGALPLNSSARVEFNGSTKRFALRGGGDTPVQAIELEDRP